jgi:hypothetical protein
MAHISGKNGGVYSGALEIEDCEDAWNEHTEAGVAQSTTTGKVGTNAHRSTTTTVGIAVLATEIISKDLTAYDAVYWWARTSLTTSAGDLQLLLDNNAECASPLETLNMPALTANTWKQCFAVLSDPSGLGSLISVGLKSAVDLADGTFDIDDVEALAEQDGIKSWTLDYTTSTVDTTDFADSGVRSLLPGVSQWGGSFEGYKEAIPISIGSEVYLMLGESNTAYQGWCGKAIITGAHPVTSFDGIVTYSYDFDGTGDLSVPSA